MTYQADLDAAPAADTFVLVLPCGHSAHLEPCWAGAGKRTAVLLTDLCGPTLMYRVVDLVTVRPSNLVDWIGNNPAAQRCAQGLA
jgi:hypothetical protein